jgi:hypothetical protein
MQGFLGRDKFVERLIVTVEKRGQADAGSPPRGL